MNEVDPLVRKFQKELSAGTVSFLLLAQLAKAGEPLYGYQIAKQLEQDGDGMLSGKQSALYPVLRNLMPPVCCKARSSPRWPGRRGATTASPISAGRFSAPGATHGNKPKPL